MSVKATIFWIAIVVLIVAGIGTGLGYYDIHRNVTSYLNRAQVASNIEDVHDYMLKVNKGMERYNATDGNAALIFSTAENDMSLVYQAVNRVIERCEELKNEEITSTTYQTALDDIRGTIRELNLMVGYFWWIHSIWFWLIVIFGIIAAVSGLWWWIEEEF